VSRHHHNPVMTQLVTVGVIALLTICFLLGIYVAYHHGGTKTRPANINNNVRVSVHCPDNGIPTVWGKG